MGKKKYINFSILSLLFLFYSFSTISLAENNKGILEQCSDYVYSGAKSCVNATWNGFCTGTNYLYSGTKHYAGLAGNAAWQNTCVGAKHVFNRNINFSINFYRSYHWGNQNPYQLTGVVVSLLMTLYFFKNYQWMDYGEAQKLIEHLEDYHNKCLSNKSTAMTGNDKKELKELGNALNVGKLIDKFIEAYGSNNSGKNVDLKSLKNSIKRDLWLSIFKECAFSCALFATVLVLLNHCQADPLIKTE